MRSNNKQPCRLCGGTKWCLIHTSEQQKGRAHKIYLAKSKCEVGSGKIPEKGFSLEQRVDFYNTSFGQRYPGSRLRMENGFLSGVWLLGNNYKGSGYYGAYPPQYLKRVDALFWDLYPVIHLFSGSLPKSSNYLRININEDPDIVGDVHHLSEMRLPKKYLHPKVIYADPPYTKQTPLSTEHRWFIGKKY